MSLSLKQAMKVLTDAMPDREIKGSFDQGPLFLFLAPSTEPLEGHLDPFFQVDKETGEFEDFSPTDYDNSAEIITALLNNTSRR